MLQPRATAVLSLSHDTTWSSTAGERYAQTLSDACLSATIYVAARTFDERTAQTQITGQVHGERRCTLSGRQNPAAPDLALSATPDTGGAGSARYGDPVCSTGF